jgi:phage tail-like protein
MPAVPLTRSSASQRDLDKLGENHFVLQVPAVTIGAFSECTGLTFEREVLEYQEGGLNGFVHKLPGRTKYTNLVLKRGITDQDALQRWFWECQTKARLSEISVQLVDATGAPRRTWAFAGAFPVKWTGPKLSAGSDSPATEELEIAHQGLVRL